MNRRAFRAICFGSAIIGLGACSPGDEAAMPGTIRLPDIFATATVSGTAADNTQDDSTALGIGWQGLGEIYHETIVSRAGERLAFAVDLPRDPWLDVTVGMPGEDPVTFVVAASRDAGESILLRKTVTTPERWESERVPLDSLAGENVTLTLSLESESADALGYWGSPAIRSRTADGADAPRGVILIISDTTRRDHLPIYGYARDTTPVISRIAEEGVVFDDVVSQGTWTKVSVPSMLSSTYPLTNGVHDQRDRLPATVTTIAEVYRQAGYATLSMSSIQFTGQQSNLHQGFEVLHERNSIDLPRDLNSKTARAYVDRLLPWIEAHRDTPFFVLLHLYDAHPPFETRQPFADWWGEPETKQQYLDGVEALRETYPRDTQPNNRGTPNLAQLESLDIDPVPFARQELDWYDGSIRGLDAELGRLFEAIDQLGLRDDVVVAFTADHGEEFLDHGHHWHRSIYGELSNVPLVLWGPAFLPAGSRVADLVQSMDLMPTLLALSGLPVPGTAQGQSLLPLIRPAGDAAGSWQARPAFTERLRHERQRADAELDLPDAYSVVDGRYKLVHNTWIPDFLDLPEYQLFDHVADPNDLIDIAAANPAIVETMSRLLEDWRTYAERVRIEDNEATLGELDEATIEQLRSFGYIN